MATVSGGDKPSGTITWSLYGPNDNACTGTPLSTSAVSVNGDGAYTSPPLTPATAGTYHWVATYSGDANNVAVGPVGCTDPNEAVTIGRVTPGLTTSATPAAAAVGSAIKDVATLTGGDHPTGTITWKLYGPNDNACTGTPLTTSAVTVNGDNSYTSPALTPSTAGTYHWVATYSGDVNNVAVGPVGCTDPRETVTIGQVAPTLTTSASPASAPVGSSIRDVAQLSGGDHPTGSITWRLYGPNDSACTNPGAPSVTVTDVSGDGSYASPPLTPSTTGTYQWVATYDGDTNNAAVGPVGCSDPGETVTITKVTPGLATSASPASAPVGAVIRDVASLTGGDAPSGTITWSLYGPNDNACTGTPVTTSPVAVTGDGSYTSPPLTPSTAGTYHWVASYSGDTNNAAVGPVGCTDPNETVTITKVTPGLTTKASPSSAAVGTAIKDVATLTGGDNPTGTITWSLYGPNDNSCTGTPLTTSAVTVSGDNSYTSPALTPSTAGTYHWVATYSGDGNNAGVGPVGCTDPNETVTITKALPTLSTSATPASAPVGTAIKDVATLTGGDNPTGTITWSLYGPNDNACTGTPLTTSAVTVNGDNSYTSPALTPTTAGTYHWVATYSGDTNNSGSGPVGCSDPSETVSITKVGPAISTSATPASAPVGTAIKDVATLTGGDNPTGTITWSLYGPNDNSCTGTPLTTSAVTVSGDNSYTSPALTPSTAGPYHWVASYSGDTNNNAVSGACSAPDETVTITPVTPALTTSASPASAAVGSAIKDIANLTGGDDPTGTITWKLYGPSDTACTGAALTTSAVTVNGAGAYTSPPLTPSTAGTYHWVATYSGDTNNNGVGPVGCADPNEAVTIGQVGPSLTTSASPPTAPVGATINDVATLSGGDNPSGTITWTLYGPNDTSGCTAGAAFPPTTLAVHGDGQYTSPPLTPTTAGSYHWVATYSGDVNNVAVGPVGCTDPGEAVTIGQVTPTLATIANPASITIGGSVQDNATLSGGNNPTGTITWSLYGPNDSTCSGTPVTTGTANVSGDGTYAGPTWTTTAGGTYHWVATYSGDKNNNAVGPVGCNDPNETLTVFAPSFTLVKLQSLTSSGFTTAPITAQVGQTINYEIVVTNTGNTPLSLALVDAMCTGISAPTGNIVGGNLQVGGTATYTCSHVVVAADFPVYVNVAQVTATPPGGPPLPPERSSVLANIPRQQTLACTTSTTKLTETAKNLKTVRKTSKGKTVTTTNRQITAILSDPNHGTDISRVVFSLDGRPLKTLTKPNLSGGRFEAQVLTSATRYGAHRITAAVTMICGPSQNKMVQFLHALPAIKVVPRFTG